MIRFNSDYTEGCHPAILEKLAETNMEQTAGSAKAAHSGLSCRCCGQNKKLTASRANKVFD